MKTVLITFIFLFLAPLHSFPFKNIFIKGNPGDYSVYQNGSSVTILNIHSKELPFIIFEEITMPKSIYENVKGKDLNTWVNNKAPGSTCWTLMEINLNTLEVTGSYCLSRKSHLYINKEDTLIASLLNLDLTPVKEEELSRIGPRRGEKVDSRPLWKPSMFVGGKKKEPKKMDVYQSNWENDGSALSGKQIQLYVLNDFPFPYWIQVDGSIGSKKMIAIDSGSNLISSAETIPRVPPKFISGLVTSVGNQESLSFTVQGDRTMSGFTPYFLEVEKGSNKLIPIEAKCTPIDQSLFKFHLDKATLHEVLTPGKKYRLTLSYEEGDQINSIVSKDIIHWK